MAVNTVRQSNGWRLISANVGSEGENTSDRIECNRDETPSLLYVPIDWIGPSDVRIKCNFGPEISPLDSDFKYIYSANNTYLALMTGFDPDKGTPLSALVSNPFARDFKLVSTLNQATFKTCLILMIIRRIP